MNIAASVDWLSRQRDGESELSCMMRAREACAPIDSPRFSHQISFTRLPQLQHNKQLWALDIFHVTYPSPVCSAARVVLVSICHLRLGPSGATVCTGVGFRVLADIKGPS